jgi:hypothetical protein
MPRPSLRLRSPLFVLGALLAGSLFAAGCKQGIGDRCEVASDCASNYCVPGGGTPNSICCDQNNQATCVIQTSGVGGAKGSGGVTGSGGAAATGGAGGTESDGSTD